MDFISQMENALGKEAVKEIYPMQPGDVKQTFADSSKLEKLVNYESKTTIYEGVLRFVEWFKKYHLS